MKLTGNKIFSFMLAAAFALTLGGCGGGGSAMMDDDGDTMPPVVDPGPTDEEIAAQEEADALMAAQDGAIAAAVAAMAAVGSAVDPVASGNAYKYAGMAQSASDSAAMATTSAMALGHQTAAETARDSAMMAGGMRGLGITGLANKIINQDAMDEAEFNDKTPPKAISNAGRVSTAITAAAAAMPNFPTDDAGVHQNYMGPDDVVGTGAVYKAGGSTITVGDPTLGRGETPVHFMDRDGNHGVELRFDDDREGMTYAIAYTDIEAPTEKPTPGDEITNLDDLQAAITDDNNPVVTGNPGDGSTFTGTYNEDPDDNTPSVTGVFTCPDDTVCGIATNKKGGVVAIAGYSFNAVSTEMTKTDDADYLTWGLWAMIPIGTGADEDEPVFIGSFGNGSAAVYTVNAALTGTATYEGSATGLYSAAGMVEYFEADAMLEANFGGKNAIPAEVDNDPGILASVKGYISNITAGGMSVSGMLELGSAMITEEAIDDGSGPGTFMGSTKGRVGDTYFSGMWGGQFFGSKADEAPTSAAGTFGGSSAESKASILGAFGAWKTE